VIIGLDHLTDLLDRLAVSRGDTSAREALAIKFVDVHGPTRRGATFQTASGGLLIIDMDDDGKVVGLEII
jgi:hypothetical protein